VIDPAALLKSSNVAAQFSLSRIPRQGPLEGVLELWTSMLKTKANNRTACLSLPEASVL